MILMIIGNGSGVSRWDATFLFKSKVPIEKCDVSTKVPIEKCGISTKVPIEKCSHRLQVHLEKCIFAL